jgi:hypothetical protein
LGNPYNPYGIAALDRATADETASLIGGTRLRYRREFTDPTLAAWDVVTGAGHTISVANSNLTVTTGTTINTETSLVSKQTFTPPFKAQFGFKISQKIANQDFFMELVAVNADGTLDETAVAAWRVSGTDSVTTSIARYETRNGQVGRLQSGNVTVATQTTDAIYEIILDSDEVSFHNKSIDSTSGKTLSATRNSVAPDPNRLYKLRYRIANTGTAPASSTTFTAGFVTALDYQEVMVEVTGASGISSAASQLPVVIVGGSVGLSNGTIGANSAVTGTTIAKVLTAATTNATLVKATSARLYGYHLSNTTAAWRYVRVYNQTTAPTVGTNSPALVIPIAPGMSAIVDHTVPVSLGTGFSYSITAGSPDLDATVTAVGDVVGHFLYA